MRATPALEEDEEEQTQRKSKSLSPADVRQLTVYSELLKRRENLNDAPEM